ncbi:hypothetical protein ACJMK2_029006, partial [Sinanodonta woodiana]
EREDVQKKTFTKWINSQLSKANLPVIEDLFVDLRDGTHLLSLLEVLSGLDLKREKGRLRVHYINNVNRALDVLARHYNIKLVNISSNDIVDGNQKLTLGLVWSIILHWQVKDVMKDLMDDLRQTNLERTLLAWCRQSTQEYENVDVRNFTNCWRDGLAFNALIHHYRPHLFSYESLFTNTAEQNLEHAFRLAYENLGVDRLLDPEDVAVDNPDKKSVMMYLMCLFKALPHSDIPLENNDIPFSPQSPEESIGAVSTRFLESTRTTKITEHAMSMSSSSSRHSTMSSASVDLISYQDALENVLTWLLEAEEVMEMQEPISVSVIEVKKQFSEHEDFMLELTKHQDSIGNVLREGNDLIAEGKVTADEENEIRIQMSLLNNRWEDLRLKALSRQSQLQQVLMTLQQQQLDELASWLAKMEERIANQGPIGTDLQTIKAQVDEHKKLQEELEQQQRKVDSLQNMVVVVDDNNTESACEAMEKQLQNLGKRWATICHWTEEQWLHLQDVLLKWQHFAEEEDKFSDWLLEKEAVLIRMKHVDVSDQTQALTQVQELKTIEREMVQQVKKFESLYECGQQIAERVNNEEAVRKLSTRLEEFQDRWKRLVEQMEQRSKMIVGSGIDLGQIPELKEDLSDFSEEAKLRSSASNVAKRRKIDSVSWIEFDKQYKKICEWIEKIESGLELLTQGETSPQEQFTEEEQVVLIEDTEQEMKSHSNDVNRILSLGRTVVTELKMAGDSNDEVAIAVQSLEERWENLNRQFSETQAKVNLNNEKKKIYYELGSLQELMNSYEKWIGTLERIPEEAVEISRQLEQCKIKLKAIKSHEDRVEKMNHQAQLLLKKSRSPKLDDDLREFNKRWEVIFKNIGERQRQLTEALEKAPPKAYLEAIDALLTWINNNEQVLQSESFQVTETSLMEKQRSQFKTLMDDLTEQKASLDYINKTGNDLVAKMAARGSKSEKINEDLKSLNGRWSTVTTAMQSRLDNIEKAVSQVKQYQSQITGLNSWMEEMDVFLHTEDPVTGDLQALQAQLQESNAVQEDIKTLQQNVSSINELYSQLKVNSEPSFREKMAAEVLDLNDKWDRVLSLAKQQNERLKGLLDSSQNIHQKIELLIKWLEPIKEDLSNKDYAVENPNDLHVKTKKFKKLKDEMTEKDGEVNKVNEEANDMLNKAPSGSLQDLARSLMRLNALWTDAYQRVDHYSRLYANADNQWKHFRALMDEEHLYLEKLERKVRNSTGINSDAEELSEQFDEVERLVEEHTSTENPSQLQELAQDLILNSIMADMVRTEMEQYSKRREAMEVKAKEKMSRLEDSMNQVQNIERQVLQMSQWMVDVSREIQNRLDADVLAGDVPDEYEQLKEEFRQQEELLRELEKYETEYKASGKLDASTRLERQIQTIKKDFMELNLKFKKFQRPADFDPKMSHVKRELDGIEERMYLISVQNDDLESLQDKFDQCMKFYKTMSELKMEVEVVIKTGRQIVEKKQVDFPDKLSKQLDAIKQQYNKIGAQVTVGKNNLEKAMKLSKKLRKEVSLVQDFVNRVNRELDKKEDPANMSKLDAELIFVTSTQDEMTNKQGILTNMRELHSQLTELAEEGELTETKHNIENLSEQWTQLTFRLDGWRSKIEADLSVVDSLFVEFQTTLMGVKDWLTQAEVTLATYHKLPVPQKATDTWRDKAKTLQLQFNETRSQVDEVRDAAVETMSKSDRYTKMVEPELTHLNQRWEDMENKIKEIQRPVQFETIEIPKTTVTMVTASCEVQQMQEVDVKFQTLFDHAMNTMQSFEDNVLFKGEIRSRDMEGDPQDNAKNLEDGVQKLRAEMESVINCGEKLVSQIELSDPKTSQKIDVQVQKLRERLESLKLQTETKRKALVIIAPLWYQFQESSQNLSKQIDDMEMRVLENPAQSKAFDEELKRRHRELESLRQQGQVLDERGVGVVDSELKRLTHRLSDVRSQIVRLPQPALTLDASEGEQIIRTSYSVTANSRDVGAPTLAHFINEIRCQRDQLSEAQRTLSGPVLGSKDLNQFEAQEPLLKEVQKSIDEVKRRIEDFGLEKEEVLKDSRPEEVGRVQELLADLQQQWQQTNELHKDRLRRWSRAAEQWSQYHSDMKELTQWLAKTEARLLELKHWGKDFKELEKAYSELEKGIRSHQGQVNSMNAAGNEIIRQSAAPDAQSLRETLNALNQKWKGVYAEILDRQESLEAEGVKTSEFTEDMDELFFWLDETENILGTTLQPEEVFMEEVLEKVKDREDDVATKQQSLDTINRNGETLLSQDTLSPQDKENIKRDLDSLNGRWTKVVDDISKRRHDVEERLQKLRSFSASLIELQSWVKDTRNLLEKQRHTESATSLDELDSIIVDPQTTQSAIDAHQANLDQVNQTFTQLTQNYPVGDKESSSHENLKQRIDALNSDWKIIRELAEALEPVPIDSSVHEVFTKVKVEAQRSSPSPWPGFHKSIAELRDWLTLLEKMLRTQHVTVGDISDIEQTIQKQKSLLQDFENKRPQLEEVTCKAENFHKNSTNEADKKSVKEKVDRLQKDWDQIMLKMRQRQTELDDMLLECRQFDELYAEFDRWLAQVEEDLDSDPTSPQKRNTQRLISQNKTLESEVREWQEKADSLKRLADKLVEEYREDDTSSVKLKLERAMNRWSTLLNRLAENMKAAQKTDLSPQQLDLALDEFIRWLESTEKSYERLDEETSKNEVLEDKDLCSVYLEQFR